MSLEFYNVRIFSRLLQIAFICCLAINTYSQDPGDPGGGDPGGGEGITDSMDPCDPASVMYDPCVCDPSSCDPCDPTGPAFDPCICDPTSCDCDPTICDPCDPANPQYDPQCPTICDGFLVLYDDCVGIELMYPTPNSNIVIGFAHSSAGSLFSQTVSLTINGVDFNNIPVADLTSISSYDIYPSSIGLDVSTPGTKSVAITRIVDGAGVSCIAPGDTLVQNFTIYPSPDLSINSTCISTDSALVDIIYNGGGTPDMYLDLGITDSDDPISLYGSLNYTLPQPLPTAGTVLGTITAYNLESGKSYYLGYFDGCGLGYIGQISSFTQNCQSLEGACEGELVILDNSCVPGAYSTLLTSEFNGHFMSFASPNYNDLPEGTTVDLIVNGFSVDNVEVVPFEDPPNGGFSTNQIGIDASTPGLKEAILSSVVASDSSCIVTGDTLQLYQYTIEAQPEFAFEYVCDAGGMDRIDFTYVGGGAPYDIHFDVQIQDNDGNLLLSELFYFDFGTSVGDTVLTIFPTGLVSNSMYDVSYFNCPDYMQIPIGSFTSLCGISSSCTDGIQNGDETGIDCGGSCAPCDNSCATLMMTEYSNCSNGSIYISLYHESGGIENDTVTLGLYDTSGTLLQEEVFITQNPNLSYAQYIGYYELYGLETGMEGYITYTYCNGSQTVTSSSSFINNCPSCTDGIQNGDEGGIDCGGSYCDSCPGASPCNGSLMILDDGCSPGAYSLLPTSYGHNISFVSDDFYQLQRGTTVDLIVNGYSLNDIEVTSYDELTGAGFSTSQIGIDASTPGLKTAVLSSIVASDSSCMVQADTLSVFEFFIQDFPTFSFSHICDENGNERIDIVWDSGLAAEGHDFTIQIAETSSNNNVVYDYFIFDYGSDIGDTLKTIITNPLSSSGPYDIVVENCTQDLSILVGTTSSQCSMPTCTDGIQNGDETGVDCGGQLCDECGTDCEDLTITATIATATSTQVQYDYVITNIGNVAVDLNGPTSVEYDNVSIQNYWTNDPNTDNFPNGSPGGGSIIGLSPLPTLQPGETFVGTFQSSNQSDSYRYLMFKVDWGNQINECDETNNVFFFDLEGLGCTNPQAHNFDPQAAIDYGSCETCDDGIQNGDETGVDCGGSCPNSCTPDTDLCTGLIDIYDACQGYRGYAIQQTNTLPYVGYYIPAEYGLYGERVHLTLNGVQFDSVLLSDEMFIADTRLTIDQLGIDYMTPGIKSIVLSRIQSVDGSCLLEADTLQHLEFELINDTEFSFIYVCEPDGSSTIEVYYGDHIDPNRYYEIGIYENTLQGTYPITSFYFNADASTNVGDLATSFNYYLQEGPTYFIGGRVCYLSETKGYGSFTVACSSCTDGIQNGDEEGIDCGGTNCSPCQTTNVCNYEGIWSNTDPNSREIPIFELYSDGVDIINQTYGSCSPTYCNWGTVTATSYDDVTCTVTFFWDQGFAHRFDTIRLVDNDLIERTIFSTYTDSSGRADRTSVSYFNRVSCFDGIQNGDETGVDCGGTFCAPCETICDYNFYIDYACYYQHDSVDYAFYSSNAHDALLGIYGSPYFDSAYVSINAFEFPVSLYSSSITLSQIGIDSGRRDVQYIYLDYVYNNELNCFDNAKSSTIQFFDLPVMDIVTYCDNDGNTITEIHHVSGGIPNSYFQIYFYSPQGTGYYDQQSFQLPSDLSGPAGIIHTMVAPITDGESYSVYYTDCYETLQVVNGIADCGLLASCDDGFQNGDEQGIDCGGTNCTECDICSFDNVITTESCDTLNNLLTYTIESNIDHTNLSYIEAYMYVGGYYYGSSPVAIDDTTMSFIIENVPAQGEQVDFYMYAYNDQNNTSCSYYDAWTAYPCTRSCEAVISANGVGCVMDTSFYETIEIFEVIVQVTPDSAEVLYDTVITQVDYVQVGSRVEYVLESGTITNGEEVTIVISDDTGYSYQQSFTVTGSPAVGDVLYTSSYSQYQPGMIAIDVYYCDGSNSNAVIDECSCNPDVPFYDPCYCGGDPALCSGCTDPSAHNYDPNVYIDNGTCETCFDGIQNGDETSIDCGGILCAPCAEDCSLGISVSPICVDDTSFVMQITYDSAGYVGQEIPYLLYDYNFSQYEFGTITLDSANMVPGGVLVQLTNPSILSSPQVYLEYSICNSYNGQYYQRPCAPSECTASFNVREVCTYSDQNVVYEGNTGGIIEVNLPNQFATFGVFMNGSTSPSAVLTGSGSSASSFALSSVGDFSQPGTYTITLDSIVAYDGSCATTMSPIQTSLLEVVELPILDVETSCQGLNPQVRITYQGGGIPQSEIIYYLDSGNGYYWADNMFTPETDAIGTMIFQSPVYSLAPGQPYSIQLRRCGDVVLSTYNFTNDCGVSGCTDVNAHNYDPLANISGDCETCSDGIQNGDETGIDCGGILCGPCVAVYDFSISDASITPATVTAGSTITASCTQAFDQSESGDNVYVSMGYYYSTDDTFDGGDLLLATDVSNLSAAITSEAESATLPIPVDAASGFILFVADHLDQYDEGNGEDNNVVSLAITIEALPEVDNFFIVDGTADIADMEVMAGQTTDISCRVGYSGASTTTLSVRTGYYLSTDDMYDVSDILLEEDNSTLSLSDMDDPEVATITIPIETVEGDYFILFFADDNDQYDEGALESDNIIAIPLFIEAAPEQTHDFFITEARTDDASTTYNEGDLLTLRCRQNYDGNSPTRIYVKMGYYLSTNQTFDSSMDIYLGDDTSTLDNVDTDDPESLRTDIPIGLSSGTYYVLFVANYLYLDDPAAEYPETDYTNNVSSVPITINGSNATSTIAQIRTASSALETEPKFTAVPITSLEEAVYPNPTNGRFFIEILEQRVALDRVHVSIIDPVGKIIRQITGLQTTKTAVDLSDAPPGVYQILLRYDNIHSEKRIILVK